MKDKLEFDCRRGDTEPSERAAIIAAPGTNCPRGHPRKLKFDCRRGDTELSERAAIIAAPGTKLPAGASPQTEI